MPQRSDSKFGRLVMTARTRSPLVRVTVSWPLARFLTAAGARPAKDDPPKDDPRTTLKQRIDLRRVWITFSRVLEADEELERLLLILLDAHDRGDKPNAASIIDNAVKIDTFLERLSEFVSQVRFSDRTETRSVRQDIRYSLEEADILINAVSRACRSLSEGEISNAAIACRSIHDMLNPWRDRIAVWLGTPPPDLRGVDLKGIEMSVNDVAGAIWDPATIWPSEDFAVEVRGESDEISPNVYRVRLGTEQRSFIF